MKQVVIVIPKGKVTLSSVTGAFQVLNSANAYWQRIGNKSKMEVRIAGFMSELKLDAGYFSIHPINIKEIKKADLIIIPSCAYDENFIGDNKLLIHWVTKQYHAGAEIASICSGAFLLASTGLIDGKSCSTHWNLANHFRQLFPDVDLQPDKLITDENGIYTNGGAFSFLNLMIYLVEKYFNRETAIFCTKVFQIEVDRNSQSTFAIFTGQKQHGDEMVVKAQAYIEKNLHEKISVEHLSSKFAVGRRNFDRRFVKATGNTPLEYAQRVKIESAKKTLENTRKTINEVMYDVGYSDIKAFREVFRKITGMSPIEYKGKYNKEAVLG
ncbi:MAG: helix-turn-helix domain-containing protein [Chitinophagales bacterium]